MSLILNIDTALTTASVCLARDNDILQTVVSENRNDHAAWLHPAVTAMLKQNGVAMQELEAVAVSIGPGSYTGLRIGLSAAKGFCYALDIPLIAVSTLEILAFAVRDEATDLICPVIDARRMEIFTALYDNTLQEKIPPCAMTVDENSFSSWLASSTILFCGDGAFKLQKLISKSNALFTSKMGNATHLARLSIRRFHHNEFAELAYTEPLYLKEFYKTQDREG